MTGVPRVRRYPLRPIVRALDPCKVASAGNRVFGKRYARIAHCFTPELVLALDKVQAADVPSTVFRYTQAALAAMPDPLPSVVARLLTADERADLIRHVLPARLPVSQGEPKP